MLLAIGVIQMLVCGLLLPESHPPSKRIAFHPLALLRSCWHVARGPAFLLLAFAAALSIAPLFAYIGSAPAIILERWHLNETQFYYVFIPVVAGFMGASVVGSHMAGRVPRPRQIALGFGLMFFSAVTGLVAHLLWDHTPILLTQLLLFCVAIGVQLSNPILSLEMLDMHPLARGSAASVQAFISLGIGGVMMGMIAPVLHGNLGLLALISLAAYLIAWFAWRAGRRLRDGRRAGA
jgi:DHA1 family bicyclomycin/chloramphenicol resistance-like MFS transporter